MTKSLIRATGLGALALVVACLAIWMVVSTWDSVSMFWINAGLILPVIALVGGFSLARADPGTNRTSLRAALTVVALGLGTLGNYLAFVITSHTWNAGRIPPDQQSFLYQLLHPGVLPGFVQKTSSEAMSGISQGWPEYVLLGAVLSPLMFWWFTKPPREARLRSG